MNKYTILILIIVALLCLVSFSSCEKNEEKEECVHIEEVDKWRSPTCQEVGLTEGKHCSKCGEILVAQEEIPKSECYFRWKVTKYATKTENGERRYECVYDCGSVLETQIIYAGSQYMEYELKGNLTYYLVSAGNCTDKDVIIPKIYENREIVGIDSKAIGYGVVSVTLSENISYIAPDAFDNTSNLIEIFVADGNENYISVDGVLYSKDGKTLVKYPCAREEKVFEIPSGVTTISNNAFGNAKNLEGVIIPDSVTVIEDQAFAGCKGLTGIEFPNSLKTLGAAALYNCVGIEKIVIPDSVTEIGNYLFNECTALTDVTLPSNLTEITEGMFYHCYSLETVNIPQTVTKIGKNGFMTCYNLSELTIPEAVTTIELNAFWGVGLKTISIPKNVTSINYWAFDNCQSLESINVDPENQRYESVDGVLYSKGLQVLITYPKARVNTTCIVPDGVEYIIDYSFKQCKTIEHLVIPDSVIYIGEQTFYSCDNLKTVVIGKGVVDLSKELFFDCGLVEISLTNSIQTISSSFAWCSDLVTINFDGTIDEWMAIDKASSFDNLTGEYTVYCNDGTVSKSGEINRE